MLSLRLGRCCLESNVVVLTVRISDYLPLHILLDTAPGWLQLRNGRINYCIPYEQLNVETTALSLL